MFQRLIENRERHARLMGEMMQRFGVLDGTRDLSIGQAMALERAARTCQGCASTPECERWVAETQGTAGAETFCPNARLFQDF